MLAEKDYTVNYDDGSIELRKALGKGKILVRYNSQKRVMTLKSLKVKALYAVDVLSRKWMIKLNIAKETIVKK